MSEIKKENYNPQEIEPKWQAVWDKEKTYQPDLSNAKKPFYNLMMFPYPSAEGLHVGNMYAFTGADVYGRFKRMQGFAVFEPIGLDGFGIHSENYALKVGRHPMEQAELSEQNFYRQLRTIGNGYDWEHTVETYKPEYYKWTQWIFIELFKAGLAFRQKSPVNFCPSCKTVLADEQVEDGKCERCGTVVEKRDLEQWYFRITEYADRLLSGLEKIDWTEKVKIAQRNWIGKSRGATITFRVTGTDNDIGVFTTRPDTLHGATFLVVAPEHPIVAHWMDNQNVSNYIKEVQSKSAEEKLSQSKAGVFSGAYALNPINNQQMPIWIADYVLIGYGTGAIMAVPAHDERDFAFAKKYELPIIPVVANPLQVGELLEEAYIGEGELINSGEWNGWKAPEAKDKAITWLEEKKIGKSFTTYHLRDWLISRQRYWGPPIPMIYCESCAKLGKSYFTTQDAQNQEHDGKFFFAQDKSYAEKRELLASQMPGWYPSELPVLLPKVENYKPLGTGQSPLASDPEFSKVSCPGCGAAARRETDVSDTFLDSSWYFFRYLSPHFDGGPWERDKARAWLPVTNYIGGAEHSVLHLLYVRFLTKFFKDVGLINHFDEPFPKFYAHGLIIKDGAKMSKSKGNVVVPDEYIQKYGADSLRAYLMFIGPFSGGGDFRDTGLEGINRFIKRVWTMGTTKSIISTELDDTAKSSLNIAIRDVTADMENLRFNTALAKIMTLYNDLSSLEVVSVDQMITLLKLLAPFAPHMTEELYQRLQLVDNAVPQKFVSIHTAGWPVFNQAAIKKGDVVIAVQINGKLRDTMTFIEEEASLQEKVEAKAKESEQVRKHLEGKEVRKVIFVPGKIINFVI